VAGRIGAHEQTVRGSIKTGELTAARFGTRIGYLIRLGDYEDFLRHRRPTPETRIGRNELLTRTEAAHGDRSSTPLRETRPRREFRCGWSTALERSSGMIAPDLTFPIDPL
jgi:hypothetical protein